MKSILLPVVAAIAAACLLTACEKDDQHPVPFAEVSIRIANVDLKLTHNGSSIQFPRDYAQPAGFQGVMVYRLTDTEYRAFDRACPSDPFNCVLHIKQDDPQRATADCTDSVFLLIDGSVESGTAKHALRQYRAVREGTAVIVTNF